MLGAVHLLAADGAHFQEAIAPSLPPSYFTATNGMRVDSKTGPCCWAVLSRDTVIVPDVAADEKWTAFAAFMLGHWDRYGFGFLVIATISDLANPIGHAGFKYVDAWPNHWPDNYDEIELGYSLVPRARGKGYVTEAARAALTAAFMAFDIPYIRAKCRQDNPKSAAVLLRCGMQEQEVTDKMRRFKIVRPT